MYNFEKQQRIAYGFVASCNNIDTFFKYFADFFSS